MYKKAWSEEVKARKVNPHSSDDEIFEMIKKHIYGRECHYLLLRCSSSRCVEGYEEIGALLVGKSFNITLFPIPVRVYEIHLLSRQVAGSEGIDDNIILSNELWKVKEFKIIDEYYIVNTSVRVLSSGDNIDAIKVVTELGNRLVFLKSKDKSMIKHVKQRRRKKKRKLKKKR